MDKQEIKTAKTLESELMEAINKDFNEYMRNIIGKRTKAGFMADAKRGIYPFKAALGYKKVKNKTGFSSIVIDPKKASYVKKAFELREAGTSVMDIADILSNEGFRDKNGNKVSSSQIKHILQNILYTGKFIYSGKLYEGKYKPIISQELFDKVQTLIGCVPKKPLTKRETKNAVIYVRTAISGGYGIENQTKTGKTFAEKEGFHVIKVFVDDGKSANSLDRPAFNEMLEYCNNNKNMVDAVIVWRYDRLTRSMLDYQHTIIPFLKQNNIKLLSATESNVDLTDTLLVHKLRILLNDFESKSCEDICKECKGRNYDHHLDQITSISI